MERISILPDCIILKLGLLTALRQSSCYWYDFRFHIWTIKFLPLCFSQWHTGRLFANAANSPLVSANRYVVNRRTCRFPQCIFLTSFCSTFSCSTNLSSIYWWCCANNGWFSSNVLDSCRFGASSSHCYVVFSSQFAALTVWFFAPRHWWPSVICFVSEFHFTLRPLNHSNFARLQISLVRLPFEKNFLLRSLLLIGGAYLGLR